MSLPKNIQIIQAGRGAGKTYNMMTAVQEYVNAHSWEGVLVVVPDHRMVHWWVREWQQRFPFLTVPKVLSVRSLDRVRGYRLHRVFIDNVDWLEDGIYDQDLDMVWFALRGDAYEAEVYVTSSLNRLNDSAHTPYEVLVERRQAEYEEQLRLEAEHEREMEELETLVMVLKMMNAISDSVVYQRGVVFDQDEDQG